MTERTWFQTTANCRSTDGWPNAQTGSGRIGLRVSRLHHERKNPAAGRSPAERARAAQNQSWGQVALGHAPTVRWCAAGSRQLRAVGLAGCTTRQGCRADAQRTCLNRNAKAGCRRLAGRLGIGYLHRESAGTGCGRSSTDCTASAQAQTGRQATCRRLNRCRRRRKPPELGKKLVLTLPTQVYLLSMRSLGLLPGLKRPDKFKLPTRNRARISVDLGCQNQTLVVVETYT